MPGVQVSFDETLVVTDSEGKFVLSNVKPASSYELSFARSGYVRQWQVFAWGNIEPHAYFDPTVVQQA